MIYLKLKKKKRMLRKRRKKESYQHFQRLYKSWRIVCLTLVHLLITSIYVNQSKSYRTNFCQAKRRREDRSAVNTKRVDHSGSNCDGRIICYCNYWSSYFLLVIFFFNVNIIVTTYLCGVPGRDFVAQTSCRW